MTVSGFESYEHACRRAAFYRSRGYVVEICSAPGTLLGVYLRCTPVAA